MAGISNTGWIMFIFDIVLPVAVALTYYSQSRPKAKPNRWAGIRIRVVASSPEVWRAAVGEGEPRLLLRGSGDLPAHAQVVASGARREHSLLRLSHPVRVQRPACLHGGEKNGRFPESP